MPGESFVQVNAGGGGPKLHTWRWTIGGNDVEDEAVYPGEYPLPTYIAAAQAVSVATLNDHAICLNAGANLKVRIRRIRATQHANATTAGPGAFQLLRTITVAPTGGTAITPTPLGAGAPSGATARALPAVKGTESTIILQDSANWRQTPPAGGGGNVIFEWRQDPNCEPLIIPNGVTNGLAFKITTAIAAATLNLWVTFVETAW
jgi:hypothetical protein